MILKQKQINLTLGVPEMSLRELSKVTHVRHGRALTCSPFALGFIFPGEQLAINTTITWTCPHSRIGGDIPGVGGPQTDGFLQVPITNSFIHGCFC